MSTTSIEQEIVGPTSFTPATSLSVRMECQAVCTYGGRNGPLTLLDTQTKCLKEGSETSAQNGQPNSFSSDSFQFLMQ